MLEVKIMPNLDFGIEESDKSKGDEDWCLTELTNYITENRVERNVLHHLCVFSIETWEMRTYRELEPALKTRLISDLERNMYYVYYTKEKRDFDVELEEEYLNFYLNGGCISKITLEKFEDDLKKEPDVKLNALFEFQGNRDIASKRLTYDEREELADKVVAIYENLLEERSFAEARAEEEKKRAKEERKKRGLFGKKRK